jgi:Ni/Co efflux regulator RcnB
MKHLIVLAATLSLLVPAVAAAQPANQNNAGPGGPMTKPAYGQQPVGNKKPGKPGNGMNPGKPGNGMNPGKPGNGMNPGKPGPGMKPPHHRPPSRPGTPGAVKPPHRPGHKPPARPGYGYHKPRPTQYYWRGKWFNRIRATAFRYPAGYHYRIWNAGDRLPALFLTSAYFYDGYAQMGLETPPPGYRWVRYGPDLLLVDIHTNAVEQVVYGAFY